MNSCFFIGHADAPESIFAQLTETVEMLIVQEHIRYFYVGNHGNFDRLAAMAVKYMKHIYPSILLTLVLSYHPAECTISIPEGFDGTYYPEGMEAVPRRYAIVRANRRMVKDVDYLIAYVWHPASNARNILEYAKRREKKGLIRIINISGGNYEKETANSLLDPLSRLS